MSFEVNGVEFASDQTPPYELTFTVPYGVSVVNLSASARDIAGNVGTSSDVVALVAPDPFTTVQGRVVDAAGNPVAGAEVALQLNGLKAEFFDFTLALHVLPDLNELTPTVTKLVSAVNLRNPDDLFAADTFGEVFDPDYAVRFTGLIQIPESGTYTFILGSDDGARLLIDGKPVVEVTATGEFTEAQADVDLSAGSLPIEIQYFQAVGDAELQLSYIPPGGERQVVPPSALVQEPPVFTAVTGTDGTFSVSGVPTILGAVSVRATVTEQDGTQRTGKADTVLAVRQGVTDVGTVVVP